MSAPLLPHPTDRPARNPLKPTVYLGHEDMRTCPECAGPLMRASACLTCLQCGWGRCG